MWDEIVEPELQEEFSSQVKFVNLKVMSAFRRCQESPEKEGEIVILKKDADLWYGALNQARLAMEEKYQLGPREIREAVGFDDDELESAHYREEFYLTIQSLLMRYAMD